ncbi:hypothetical protein [Paenibacillus mucilaginosus]|uniref:hypothetical protein n=1 Tax=Paenibacillus mucilaginosus TaxID=61624 RepID=UPI003D1D386A
MTWLGAGSPFRTPLDLVVKMNIRPGWMLLVCGKGTAVRPRRPLVVAEVGGHACSSA